MEIRYFNKKVEEICNSLDAAKKKYPLKTAEKLIKAVNFIENAVCLNDIVNFPLFIFIIFVGIGMGNIPFVSMVKQIVID